VAGGDRQGWSTCPAFTLACLTNNLAKGNYGLSRWVRWY
jgi:hypothetical protein